MSSHFCITIRFLDGRFHGRRDGGEPEWPPSPLRVFQALVAAAAAHTNQRTTLTDAAPCLRWLEEQPAPLILAPVGVRGAKYRLYVPDNVADLVAKSWRRGNEASIADYRSEKDVQPTHLLGGDAVHYLWPLAEDDAAFTAHQPLLEQCARAITHLGWGVDMVVAHASIISDEEAAKLAGQRWKPTDGDPRNPLRVPIQGSLDDLNRRYAAFLQRAQPESFAPVPPLSKFQLVSYLSGAESPAIAFAAFNLLWPDASDRRPFDPVRNGMRVAAMLRHTAGAQTIAAALGWPDEKVARMVHGHGEANGAAPTPATGPRFAFVPLPSIEARGRGRAMVIGSARRALLLGMRGATSEDVQHLARAIAGQSLTDQDTASAAAILARIPNTDKMVESYTRSATTWATVTPLILPGYDDPRKYRRELSHRGEKEGAVLSAERQKELLRKLDHRIDFLIRKAIRQAGFPAALAEHAELEWSNSGFWPGSDLASRYVIPVTLRRFRRMHVRILWRDAAGRSIDVQGPLCIGSGRFVGVGLFAPLPRAGL
ncbi:MAG TPA: type I-U CRISPR-associated protein Csb2 [Chthoniobacteraceae bacterium]|jgi:CRISPR-associated protein Csb2